MLRFLTACAICVVCALCIPSSFAQNPLIARRASGLGTFDLTNKVTVDDAVTTFTVSTGFRLNVGTPARDKLWSSNGTSGGGRWADFTELGLATTSAVGGANLTGETGQIVLSASGTGVLIGTTNINLSLADPLVPTDGNQNVTGAMTLSGALQATGAKLTGLATLGTLWYSIADGTATGLADVATGNALLSGGIGAAPAYGKVSLTGAVSGILPTANGGTGLDTSTNIAGTFLRSNGTNGQWQAGGLVMPNGAATGDLLVATSLSVMGNLVDVATGNVLLSGGLSTPPAYGKVGLTTHVSGVLPLANGGTGADLSATGGSKQYVKQASSGAALTVGTIPTTDLPDNGANPSANVSNTAVNGSATTWMRSDAAPNIATSAVLQLARVGLGSAADATFPLLITRTASGVTPFANSSIVLDHNGANHINILAGATSTSGVYFGTTGSAAGKGIVADHNANTLTLRNNGVNAFVINSSGQATLTGNMAIGSSTLTSALNVGSAAQFQVSSSGNIAATGTGTNQVNGLLRADNGTLGTPVEVASAGDIYGEGVIESGGNMRAGGFVKVGDKLIGTGAITSIVAGTAAGTGATIAFTNGTRLGGLVELTTGTSPTGTTVFTITYGGTAFGTASHPVFSPANANASLLGVTVGTSNPYMTGTTTTAVMSVFTGGLLASVDYKWEVQFNGK